ncbi:MAG: thymidine kinase [Clostridiales bacterium 38-18]|nr:MAG: thymidine kinase [Clostridiales bacterium 38-18]
MSKLYFRYGAMNCGKSTALMQVMHNYTERGMQAIIVKPYTDTKGGDQVVSRLGITKQVDVIVKRDANVIDEIMIWRDRHGKIDCILVDEAQFFTRNQIDQFFEIAVKQDIPVICYGLRTDFLMKGFEGSERLLLLAHSLEELKTICRCGRKAILNGRKINGEFVFEGEQVAIDGENHVEYESLCADCYFMYKESKVNV